MVSVFFPGFRYFLGCLHFAMLLVGFLFILEMCIRDRSTESISYLIYRNGMDGGQFGFQSANAVLFFVVIVAISVFQLTFMNKKEEQL